MGSRSLRVCNEMYVRQVKKAEEEEERSNRIHDSEDIGGQIMSKIRTMNTSAVEAGSEQNDREIF